jgi:HAD superfamily hydrolase (TIGR01509 family)
MTTTEAVLWDLDGVLVDSTQYHYEAFRQLVGEFGRDLAEAEFAPLFGLPNNTILTRLLGELPPHRVQALAARKEHLFRQRIGGRVRALPGAEGLVRRLSTSRIHQAIVSSAPQANVQLVLRSLGFEEAFSVIVGEEDVVRGKPDPEGFLTAAARLEVQPARCVVLEDAPAGLTAAKAAGMRCVGVATTRAAEKLAHADVVVKVLDDPVVGKLLGLSRR